MAELSQKPGRRLIRGPVAPPLADRRSYNVSMRYVDILIVPADSGFEACVQGSGLQGGRMFLESLMGARLRIRSAAALDADTECRFSLSPNLKSRYAPCPRCDGTEVVEAEWAAAQFMNSASDRIDLITRAKITCPNCEGLGVDIPGF